MAEYRYYLIPDAMTRAFPEQFGKQTPTEFFDNIADLEKRYHQLREMPYNNERTWNERTRFPYARLVVGIDRQNPDGAVAIIQVRNGVNYLCDDYRGPYADRSDAQIPQMAKKLVEVIGVDRVRPHTYTQRDGYTWVQVEKDMHITEFTIMGVGTVATGNISTGMCREGENACVYKTNGGVLETIITTIDIHTKERKSNGCGYKTEHVGLGLRGVSKEQLEKGDRVIVKNANMYGM